MVLKQNPFYPWEKILEIDKIGDHHQLILNKYLYKRTYFTDYK